MDFIKFHRSRGLVALALLVAAAAPVSAQDRGEVREVLNRAESQAARRAVEDLLGSIGVTSRANAQTLPPRAASAPGQPPAQTPEIKSSEAPAPVRVAQGTPPTAPVVLPPATPAKSASPAGAVQVPSASGAAPVATQGLGTPAEPTMIVRVPGTAESAPAVSAGVAATVEATPPPPADTVLGTAATAPVRQPVVAAGGRVVHAPMQTASVVVAVRAPGSRLRSANWCPPARW